MTTTQRRERTAAVHDGAMAETVVRITMHGQVGSISMDDFARAMSSFQRLTTAVARDAGMRSAVWAIEDLRISSAEAEVALEGVEDPLEMSRQLLRGLQDLTETAAVPDAFPLSALTPAESLGRHASRNGVTLTLIHGGATQADVSIGPAVAMNARKAKRATHVSIGGFYGQVVLADVRKKTNKFGIRDQLTNRYLPCVASSDDVWSAAVAEIQEQGLVFVHGEITENVARQPLRVRVFTLQRRPWPGGGVGELRGVDPAATDGQTAADWVRRERDW